MIFDIFLQQMRIVGRYDYDTEKDELNEYILNCDERHIEHNFKTLDKYSDHFTDGDKKIYAELKKEYAEAKKRKEARLLCKI